MVTRDDVRIIFTECDRDGDGIVWLSELRRLAASYTSLEVLTSLLNTLSKGAGGRRYKH